MVWIPHIANSEVVILLKRRILSVQAWVHFFNFVYTLRFSTSYSPGNIVNIWLKVNCVNVWGDL